MPKPNLDDFDMCERCEEATVGVRAHQVITAEGWFTLRLCRPCTDDVSHSMDRGVLAGPRVEYVSGSDAFDRFYDR